MLFQQIAERSGFSLDAKLRHPGLQRGPMQPEDGSCATLSTDAPTGLLQNRKYVLSLDFFQRTVLGRSDHGRSLRGSRKVEAEGRASANDKGTLDNISQLPDVSR